MYLRFFLGQTQDEAPKAALTIDLLLPSTFADTAIRFDSSLPSEKELEFPRVNLFGRGVRRLGD